MNISQLKLILIIMLLALIFSVKSYAGKATLHNPKYAKLILSEDGSNILTVAIDTTRKEFGKKVKEKEKDEILP